MSRATADPVTTEAVATPPVPAPTAAPARRRLAGEQLLGTGGQLAAGIGNLAFSLLTVRLLRPGEFAALATFLALYLLLCTPMASLSAGTALDPTTARRWARRTTAGGLVAAAAVAATSAPLGRLLGLGQPLVLVLATAAPSAGLVAIVRGWLFGTGRPVGAVGTLLTEPLVRIGIGAWAALLLGATGAAIAVVAAGYAAIGAGLLAARRRQRPAPAPAGERGGARATAVVFLFVAVVQTQDLVLAHRMLPARAAARFAAVSTLGGVAVFASATIPLVLLPRLARAHRGALAVAASLAGGLGLAAVGVAAALPDRGYVAVLGREYHGIKALLVPYLVAMALLGLARVLLASGCARGRGRPGAMLALTAAAAQAALIVTTASDAAGVARATLAACGLLALGGVLLSAGRGQRRAPG